MDKAIIGLEILEILAKHALKKRAFDLNCCYGLTDGLTGVDWLSFLTKFSRLLDDFTYTWTTKGRQELQPRLQPWPAQAPKVSGDTPVWQAAFELQSKPVQDKLARLQ